MENFGSENSTSKKAEKPDLEILDEHLAGKTETELTPEEKEAEAQFCRENFHKFLEWINSDQVLLHRISGGKDKAPFSSILEKGILSKRQLAKIGIQAGHGDRYWQQRGEGEADGVINHFLDIHKKFKDGLIDKEEYENGKNQILETIPKLGKLGRARVSHFLNKIIPSVIDEIGYPIHRGQGKYFHGSDEGGLGVRNPFTIPKADSVEAKNRIDARNKEVWDSLSSMISGMDLVSSTSSEYIKRKFAKQEGFLSSPHPGNPGIDVYFERPHELRLYELTGGMYDVEELGSDVGISNRVHPNRFRALRFGNYDSEKRVFMLENEDGVKSDDIPKLIELQNNRLVILDNSLISVPPLKSISIQTADTFKTSGESYTGWVNRDVHPSKIDRKIENDYLFNLALNNKKKSLAMIGEMGGIHNNERLSDFIKNPIDRETLNAIENKIRDKQQLTKEELIFLYETEAPIEGFDNQRSGGYLDNLRNQRNLEEDMLIIFGCNKEQIAYQMSEIKEGTMAYVGKLEVGIFDLIQKYNIEHIYHSFPKERVVVEDLEITDKTAEFLEKELHEKGIKISSEALKILQNEKFAISVSPEKVKIICLAAFSLGFEKFRQSTQFVQYVKFEKIFQKAQEFGLDFCPVKVGFSFELRNILPSGLKDFEIPIIKKFRNGPGILYWREYSGINRINFYPDNYDSRTIDDRIDFESCRSDSKFIFCFRKS